MRVLKQVRQYFRNYHLKSGLFHFYRGEHGPAAEYLTRVLTEDGDCSASDRHAAEYYLVQTRIGAADAFERDGDLRHAMEQYQLALEVMPSYPDVHFRYAMALRREGRLAEAAAHLEQALAVNPDYVEARLQLGYAQFDLGRNDAARASFRAAVAAREHNASANLDAAERALDAGRTADAAEIYRHTFHDAAVFRSRFEAGIAFLREEKWESAATELEAAAALAPRSPDVHNCLGIALAESGALDPAIDAFRRALALHPDYLSPWLNLAFAAWTHGEIEESRDALDALLARDPDNAPALWLSEKLGPRAKKRPPITGAAG